MLLDRFQPVMAPAAAFRTQPYYAKGQIGIVQNHQEVLQRNLIEPHEGSDRLAAVVHVTLRLAKQDSALGLIHSRQPRSKFRFCNPAGPPTFGELFHRHEPDVVAGAGILSAWVAQSRNDVALLHAGSGERPRKLLFLVGFLFGAFVRGSLFGCLLGPLFRSFFRSSALCCRSGCSTFGSSGRSSTLF